MFEQYVKERAEEERREKHRRLREKKDAFRQLLEEAKLHGKYVYLIKHFKNTWLKKLYFCFIKLLLKSHIRHFGQEVKRTILKLEVVGLDPVMGKIIL